MLFILLSQFLLVTLPIFAQVDPQANAQTRALYQRLTETSLSFRGKQKVILGHQNAFIEGRGWRRGNESLGLTLKTDMHDVAGMHPMLFGFDFLEVGDFNRDYIKARSREIHARGGIVTASWHLRTLIDDGIGDNGYLDVSAKVVKHILPGGKANARFNSRLDELVAFFLDLKDVPIIFRPWHEHNFSWFWWGEDHCTKAEYVALWRYTIEYFLTKGVHNLLYAYSPAHIRDNYLDRYPGDKFVDILGVDFYFKTPELDEYNLGQYPLGQWKRRLVWLMGEAARRKKIPALTEFGQEGIKYDNFWTDYLAWPLERAGVAEVTGDKALPARGIAYVMLWRNDSQSALHYYGPTKGNSNNANFIKMLEKGIYLGLQ